MTDWDLRCGRWQDVLADVGEVDAVITDPPYGARTHAAYKTMPSIGLDAIDYSHLTPDDVSAFVQEWAARCRGWFCAMTSHDLAPEWERALHAAGRYVFSPIVCMEPGARVRLAGDGPAQWSIWMVVSRPKSREWQRWGALPGGYVVPAKQGWRGGGRNGVMGSKPPWLMRQIIKDYTRPGDLVCDPCAGGGTTGRACQLEGRRFIGAEMDPVTHAKALAGLSEPYTPPLFPEVETATQEGLFPK